jgi:hypothetical protein
MGKNNVTYRPQVGLVELLELAMNPSAVAVKVSAKRDFLGKKPDDAPTGLDVSHVAPK